MSQKDKENTMSKLKQFFRLKGSSGAGRDKSDSELLRELEDILQPKIPVAQRCKVLKELCESDKINKLEDATIQKLWELTKDLIVSNKPAEQRHIAFTFYQKLIQSQYEDMSLMREHFFNVIQNHNVPEDINNRLELLKTLTDNGKNIKNVDDTIGEFMIKWIPAINNANLRQPFLEIIYNIIIYNAAYLDTRILIEMIQYACNLCCSMEDTKTVLQCLQVLDAALCYTVFPMETLTPCIAALCRTVNKESYCQISWKIMKNLLGTNLGHEALKTMCNILKNSTCYDEALLRGAVFYINMGLWGSTGAVVPLNILKCSPAPVLLSFLEALKSQVMIVTYEVILGIQRLVDISGKDLSEPSWDILCEILIAIADNITYYDKMNCLPRDRILQNSYHETLTTIEKMLARNELATNPDTIYKVIEYVCDDRSEISVIQLMEYKASKITPTQPQWLHKLRMFMQRFYHMRNINIRDKSIQILRQIMEINRVSYEEEILERIVIPLFTTINAEQEVAVRTSVGKILIEFASHCDTKRSLELFDIIEKLLNRPFDKFAEENRVILRNEQESLHICAIVDELTNVFILKLYHIPASHAIKIFHMLIGHLEKYYKKPELLDSSVLIRKNISEWMLKFRANATYHLGYPDEKKNNTIRFSHYLSIDVGENAYRTNQSSQQSQQQTQQLQTVSATETHPSCEMMSTISIRRSCSIIIDCLKNESDWSILHLVLTELPNILQNKALLKGIDMDSLAVTVITMHMSKNRLDTLTTTNKPVLSDFHAYILPVVSNLIPYHQFLKQTTQNRMIHSLRPGLLSRAPHVCVHALTVMLLEMPELMLRSLPDILLEMSKMSTTRHVAVPVLEFLSTLNRVPSSRFVNFVAVQYMYVFAISLPYTNPHKYDHYTVSLAHHVIAGWFLKCRLQLRRNFVNYIIKGFETNVQMPFEELKNQDFSAVNEDSSNRKRSSSLTERGSKNRERPSLQNLRMKTDESAGVFAKFHMELAETCIDFLARHTHSSCSALPKRLPTTDFLLSNGQSLSWIVGHNIVTITTSSCSSISVKNGLCDRCSLVCKAPGQPKSSSANLSNDTISQETLSSKTTEGDSQNKRYTKASLQHNNGLDSESTEFTSSNSSSTIPTPHLQQADTSGKFFRQPSNEARFSSSTSGSLEALSRRGSNPDTPDTVEANKRDSINNPSYISPQQSMDRLKQQTCACPCYGWAEICIRRPTGNMSFIMRIQNQISLDSSSNDFQLHDLINIFMPAGMDAFSDKPVTTTVSNNSIFSEPLIKENSNKKQTTIDLTDLKIMDEYMPNDMDKELEENQPNNEHQIEGSLHGSSLPSGPIDIPKSTHKHKLPSGSFSDGEAELEDDESNDVAFDENDTRSRNPVRRVNSSPEMSSNWRHPFLTQKNSANAAPISLTGSNIQVATDEETPLDIEQQQKKKNFCKDMRVSCEAIPEEIADSTPPSQTNPIKPSADIHLSKVNNTVANNPPLSEHPKSNVQSVMPPASLPASKGALLTSSTEGLLPINQSQLPRKQHSADDALQQNPNVTGNSNISSGPSNLKVKMNVEVPKLTAKPPQSPAPLSPRSLIKNTGASLLPGGPGNSNDQPRGRSKTISVVQNITPNRDPENRENAKWTYKGTRPGICPSSIFLQLFNIGPNDRAERPIQIKQSNLKAVTLLDLIPPFDIHKIGVLYVGRGQCNNEAEILRNRYGSLRYVEFLQNLGTLVSLKHAKESNIFLDMETDGRDGNFTYIWQDDIMQVTFHVATLMPNKDHDPNCNEKKKNIGNDFVSIVYNESGEEYNINTIKGQFNYACIIVQPLELNSNRIFIRFKDEVKDYISSEPKIISDSSAPRYARQLALHANLASLVAQSLKTKNQSPYASNWLERLRQIKNLKTKIMRENNSNQEHGNAASGSNVSGNTGGNIGSNNTTGKETQWLKEDFTQYT